MATQIPHWLATSHAIHGLGSLFVAPILCSHAKYYLCCGHFYINSQQQNNLAQSNYWMLKIYFESLNNHSRMSPSIITLPLSESVIDARKCQLLQPIPDVSRTLTPYRWRSAKRKPPCIGGMELVSLSCNRVFISAESVGLGWCRIAIATKWYQFHTTDKCGFLFMPWITDQYTFVRYTELVNEIGTAVAKVITFSIMTT